MDNEEYMQQLSKNLRTYRKLLGKTREEFTAPLEIDAYYYGTIERFERKINFNLLLKICDTYKVDIRQLLPAMDNLQEDNTLLIESIIGTLNTCNQNQLLIVKKFIDEIAVNI